MFFNTQIQTFGLDISDKSIKIAQIIKTRAGLQLTSLNKTNLPKGILIDGEIQNEEQLIKYIKKTIDNCHPKIKNNYAVLCLPEVKTFIKLIKIKLTNHKKLDQNSIKDLIKTYLPKHVPMPIEEICFDWQIVNQKENYIDVLIGVAPKDTVVAFSELIKKCNLTPVSFEIEAGSIMRAIFTKGDHFSETPKLHQKDIQEVLEKINFKIKKIKNKQKKQTTSQNTVYFIIDCGASRSGLITWSDGTIKFTTTLSPLIPELAEEINKAKEFYENNFDTNKKNYEIILSGGSANLKNIDKELTKLLNMQTNLANPLINLIKQKKIKIDTQEIQSYTTAIGLALRSSLVKDF